MSSKASIAQEQDMVTKIIKLISTFNQDAAFSTNNIVISSNLSMLRQLIGNCHGLTFGMIDDGIRKFHVETAPYTYNVSVVVENNKVKYSFLHSGL